MMYSVSGLILINLFTCAASNLRCHILKVKLAISQDSHIQSTFTSDTVAMIYITWGVQYTSVAST